MALAGHVERSPAGGRRSGVVAVHRCMFPSGCGKEDFMRVAKQFFAGVDVGAVVTFGGLTWVGNAVDQEPAANPGWPDFDGGGLGILRSRRLGGGVRELGRVRGAGGAAVEPVSAL